MKKMIAVLTAMLVLLSAYTAYAEEHRPDDALMQAAQEMVGQMIAVNATEGYAELFTASEELLHLVEETIAKDYSAPVRSLVITADASVIESAMVLAGLDVRDEAVLETIRMKSYAVVPSMLNGGQGVEWIAATSVMTASDVLLLEDVPPCVAYVLTDYGDDRCMTCVSFSVKEGGLAAVSANFLQMEETWKTVLFEEDLKLFFEENVGPLLAEAPEGVRDALNALMRFQVYEGK